eukprot:1344723-Pyramimonas_sp.AAC.1
MLIWILPAPSSQNCSSTFGFLSLPLRTLQLSLTMRNVIVSATMARLHALLPPANINKSFSVSIAQTIDASTGAESSFCISVTVSEMRLMSAIPARMPDGPSRCPLPLSLAKFP